MIKRNKRRLVPSLNTTSTADISFMLLIFFLVTTSMDLDKGLRRVLPPVDNQQQQQETNIEKDKLMAITITDADSAFVDGKPLEMKTLRKQVRDVWANRILSLSMRSLCRRTTPTSKYKTRLLLPMPIYATA